MTTKRAKIFHSCPECGSIKVEIEGRLGYCLNPNCLHKGPKGKFMGLSGTSSKDVHPPRSQVDYLHGGGIHRKPIHYDDDS